MGNSEQGLLDPSHLLNVLINNIQVVWMHHALNTLLGKPRHREVQDFPEVQLLNLWWSQKPATSSASRPHPRLCVTLWLKAVPFTVTVTNRVLPTPFQEKGRVYHKKGLACRLQVNGADSPETFSLGITPYCPHHPSFKSNRKLKSMGNESLYSN